MLFTVQSSAWRGASSPALDRRYHSLSPINSRVVNKSEPIAPYEIISKSYYIVINLPMMLVCRSSFFPRQTRLSMQHYNISCLNILRVT